MPAGSGCAALAAAWQAAEAAALASPPVPVGETPGEEVPVPGANEAVGAVLQLFYLCNPGKDATICRADLEAVLHEHLGRQEDVASVLRLLEEGCAGPTPERFDFLSYWHGMERFFTEASSWPQPGAQEGAEDMLDGMQRFRDGVLALWQQQEDPQQRISSQDLLALLEDIQAGSQDPRYWQDVMQIVPREDGFGLTLLEISEAVCVWLRDFLRAESEDDDKRGLASPVPLSQDGCEPGAGCTPRLATESLASVSPRLTGWLETFRGLRKGSSGSCGTTSPPTGAAELNRLGELCEVLSRAVKTDDVAARRALSQLSLAHDALARTLAGQEAELGSLRGLNRLLGEKQQQLEADLARAHEQLEEAREAARRPEEQRRRAEALERELRELQEQHAQTVQELSALQMRSADAERERVDAQRRDRQWRDHCSQLEQAADNAEGQAKWMSHEVERQAARLSSAESRELGLRRAVAAWRWRSLVQALCDAPRGLQDAAAAAAAPRQKPESSAVDDPLPLAEKREAAQQSAAAASPGIEVGRTKTLEELQRQVRAQQAELQRMRRARDELVAAEGLLQVGQEDEPATEEGLPVVSPRQVHFQQRCKFLAAQLQALLRHSHEVEQVLDNLHETRLGGGPAPDVRRRLSIQRVQEDDEAVFNELSQRLYTLEVQKADADSELRQLHARSAEQDRQLKAGKQRRDVLLAELGAARQEVICQKPGAISDLQAGGRRDYCAGSETPTTSDTRSVASAPQGGHGGGGGEGWGDMANAFLTPVQGELRSSPKGAFKAGAQKAMAVHRFNFGSAGPGAGNRGSLGSSSRRSP